MRTSRLRRTTGTVLILSIGWTLSGCNAVLRGTWKTDPIPEGEPFYIIEAQFKKDGTYVASAKKDGQNVALRGTYDFNGISLKLRSPGKPDRKYRAAYVLGGTLKLSTADKKLTMKKR